jgi:hypothetical protein
MFTGKKSQLPRAQHPPLLRAIQSKLPVSDEDYNQFIEIAERRFNTFQTDAFIQSPVNRVNRNDVNLVKIHMKLEYMTPIREHSENIEYLDKIVELLKQHDIQLLAFIPPVNYEKGIEFWGNEFETAYNANVQIIKNHTEAKGVKLIDMSYLLENSQFAAADTINELTNYDGREKELDFLISYLS